MKDIFITGKENIAVKMNKEGQAVVVEGNGTVEALLLAVKSCLEKVAVNSDNSGEPTVIFLPGYIRGLASGSVMQYVRTGKTGGGKDIEASDLELYKEIMMMYGERNLNVMFRDAQYIGKSEEEQVLRKLNDKAWEAVKSEAKKRALNGTSAKPAEPQVNPKIVAKIAELEEQLMDAILEDDEELEKSLETKIAKLKAKFGVTKADKAPEVKQEKKSEPVKNDVKSDEEDWDAIEEEA